MQHPLKSQQCYYSIYYKKKYVAGIKSGAQWQRGALTVQLLEQVSYNDTV